MDPSAVVVVLRMFTAYGAPVGVTVGSEVVGEAVGATVGAVDPGDLVGVGLGSGVDGASVGHRPTSTKSAQ